MAISLLSTLVVLNCYAQILPASGAKLTYTQVMFEYGKVKGADKYLVEVAEDITAHDSAYRSSENCVIQQTDSATATMIDGLLFGRKYRWRYAGLVPGHEPVWNGPYLFEIVSDSLLNNIMSVAVSRNDTALNAGGLIINDCTHTIVDRTGKVVWYLSNVKWHFNRSKSPLTVQQVQGSLSGHGISNNQPKLEIKPAIYDLKVTPCGTITDMEDSFPMEHDLNSKVLWKAPNDGRVSGMLVENYNHDFKRLPNGHYMVLGNEVWRKLPPYKDTAAMKKKYPQIQPYKGNEYAWSDFGTVIEYDKKKNIVWSWNSQNYFDSDALEPITRDLRTDFELRPHINAFGIDKKNEFVYVGFRDVSSIVKIEKATGRVVDSWGDTALSEKTRQWIPVYHQHDANILDDGNIAVFNNNDHVGRDSIPSVIVFSQQPTDSGNVVWRYDCNIEPARRRNSRTGGNVDQLKNGNFLVCLGNLDRIMEVTKDKQVVWQADIVPAQKRSLDFMHRLYRAHYISSLYPCYFVFQTGADTVSKESAKFNIRIFNKGSENDSYHVKISSTSGLFTQQFSTGTIVPGRSETYRIDAGKRLSSHEKIKVEISSVTNPDFERKQWVVVK